MRRSALPPRVGYLLLAPREAPDRGSPGRAWAALLDALAAHSPTVEPDPPDGAWLDLRAGGGGAPRPAGPPARGGGAPPGGAPGCPGARGATPSAPPARRSRRWPGGRTPARWCRAARRWCCGRGA